MILGISHITLSCINIQVASRRLDEAGYGVVFIQTDAPNRLAKRLFLKRYHPLHSLAYCRADTGIAVELIQHGASLEGVYSPYQVLLAAALPQAVPMTADELPWTPIWQATLGCRQPQAALWKSLQTQFWYDEAVDSGIKQPVIQAVLIPVAKAARARDFWQAGFNCKCKAEGTTATGQQWMHLVIHAPVPTWSLDIILAEDQHRTWLPWLDSAGFPCLAFLSTNLERDGDKLRQAGARSSTGKFELEVNHKLLRVEVFRGPDGELIELIEIAREINREAIYG